MMLFEQRTLFRAALIIATVAILLATSLLANGRANNIRLDPQQWASAAKSARLYQKDKGEGQKQSIVEHKGGVSRCSFYPVMHCDIYFYDGSLRCKRGRVLGSLFFGVRNADQEGKAQIQAALREDAPQQPWLD
jgi:hypothetical protein